MDKIGFNSNQVNPSVSGTKAAKAEKSGLKGFNAKLKSGTPKNDEVNFTGANGTELTVEQKQKIMKKARRKAAGWSVIFPAGISTLYRALKSDKSIAKKYKLDPEKDKTFIQEIRRQQVIQTLPSLFLPTVGGVVAWAYNAVKSPKKLKVQ